MRVHIFVHLSDGKAHFPFHFTRDDGIVEGTIEGRRFLNLDRNMGRARHPATSPLATTNITTVAMSPLSVLSSVWSALASVFSPSTTSVYARKQRLYYTVQLHNPRILLYRGSETYITFTILAYPQDGDTATLDARDAKALAKQASVQLVQKGWRAGLFGWNMAAYLGAKTKSGWDVTPVASAAWDSAAAAADNGIEDEEANEQPTQVDEHGNPIDRGARTTRETKHIAPRRRKTIARSVTDLAPSTAQVVGTYKCRVPVSTGDGYFRLYLTLPTTEGKIFLPSPTMRLFSFSLSSASPRGATLLPLPTIAPELVIRAVSLVLSTFFLAMFPAFNIIDKVLPRWMSRRLARWLFRVTGAQAKKDSVMQRFKVDQKVDVAKRQVQKVPFASAGVRTDWDLEKDASRGRAGWVYLW